MRSCLGTANQACHSDAFVSASLRQSHIPCAYGTAENRLHRAGVNSADRVLVTGASGGVGSAVVQLAKRRGAYVIAIAGESKLDSVRGLG